MDTDHVPADAPVRAPSLRARKRDRTRRAIVEAGFALFEERGYDATTIADIADAAEIGARTFFSYFASKEDLLFPERDDRIAAVADAIATRTPDESPMRILLRALSIADGLPGALEGDRGGAMVDDQARIRTRLIRTVPVVRGRALQIQLEAQREIAALLRSAFPETLDVAEAGALVGAFTGAVTGALDALLSSADEGREPGDQAAEGNEALARAFRRAVELALEPWATPGSAGSTAPARRG